MLDTQLDLLRRIIIYLEDNNFIETDELSVSLESFKIEFKKHLKISKSVTREIVFYLSEEMGEEFEPKVWYSTLGHMVRDIYHQL